MVAFLNTDNGRVLEIAEPEAFIYDGASNFKRVEVKAETTAPDMTWKKADLLAYAEERDVDLDEATTKAEILAAIEEVPPEEVPVEEAAPGNPDA